VKNQRLVSLSRHIKPVYSDVHSRSCRTESRVQSVFKAQEPVVVQDCLDFFFWGGGNYFLFACLWICLGGGVVVVFFFSL